MKPEVALLSLLLSVLAVDESLAQCPGEAPGGTPGHNTIEMEVGRYLPEYGIRESIDPNRIDGKTINQGEIDEHRERLRALEALGRELAGVFRVIDPEGAILGPQEKRKLVALVLTADRNGAVRGFVDMVVQQCEALSGDRVAAQLVDSVAELVHAASNTSSRFRAQNSIGKSSDGYRLIRMVSLVVEGLATGGVRRERAEQLAMSLDGIGSDIALQDNVRAALAQRIAVEGQRGKVDNQGDPCFDESHRLVLTEEANGELRWPCLSEEVSR